MPVTKLRMLNLWTLLAVANSSPEPLLVFVSGAPGAGKSTLGENLRQRDDFLHWDGDTFFMWSGSPIDGRGNEHDFSTRAEVKARREAWIQRKGYRPLALNQTFNATVRVWHELETLVRPDERSSRSRPWTPKPAWKRARDRRRYLARKDTAWKESAGFLKLMCQNIFAARRRYPRRHIVATWAIMTRVQRDIVRKCLRDVKMVVLSKPQHVLTKHLYKRGDSHWRRNGEAILAERRHAGSFNQTKYMIDRQRRSESWASSPRALMFEPALPSEPRTLGVQVDEMMSAEGVHRRVREFLGLTSWKSQMCQRFTGARRRGQMQLERIQ